MFCPVHGTRLRLIESLRKAQVLLCTPKERRCKPHSMTVFYYQEGFQLDVPETTALERGEEDEGG